MTPTWIAFIIGAYVIGSIPFGVIIARSKGINIREHGSKNIGATNVGRVLGRRFGITCFALDVVKGAVPEFAAGMTTGLIGGASQNIDAAQAWCWIAVAVASVLGHMYSCFLRFAGGKGVATSFGAMIAMWPLLTIPVAAALLVWIALVKTLRMVSLASMGAAATLPIAFVIQTQIQKPDDVTSFMQPGEIPLLMLTAALAVLVVVRHRSNLKRILQGTESKIGAPKQQA